MAERRKKPAGDARNGGGVSGLTGGGPSIVGVSGGMRARDVSRPREKDVARAEKTVVLRRRDPDARPSLGPRPGAGSAG